jgi:hypothetical protein
MNKYGGIKLQLQTFMYSALDGGECSALRFGRLKSGETVPIGYEAEWDPEPIWTLWRREQSLFLRGIDLDSAVIQLVI